MKQAPPPKWTKQELEIEAATARAAFRRERLDEPVDMWRQSYRDAVSRVGALIDMFGDGGIHSITPEEVGQLFRKDHGDVLRYIAGPPISADDLQVLAEIESIAPTRLANRPDDVASVLGVLEQALDRGRFPWLGEGRMPTDDERRAAVVATAALLAAQKVATYRRMTGKANQEDSVADFLESIGLERGPARTIGNLTHAPPPGRFCGESLVGSRKADIVVRLFDGRLMPIECKVSNSSLNSVKRINNDAAVKAQIWTTEFGKNQIVPCAVLTGVFKVLNLEQARDVGLTLFWAHRLDQLQEFIESTKA